jgi:SecD/SecF fusion protein
MNDPNRLMKWLLVMGMVVLALLALYPPSQKLKGGIDLVGGTSLLFEIDTTDLDREQQQGLSDRVMNILRERVDPQGQLNLEWRPIGNTRLEIRMPRPPRAALERREVFNEAMDRLAAKSIYRRDVEEALHSASEGRQAALDALVRGVNERKPLIEDLRMKYEAWVAAQAEGDASAISEASDAYETAISALLATNVPINRIRDVLALPSSERRQEELDRIRKEFSFLDAGSESDEDGKLLTKVTRAYEAWAVNKAELEDPSDLKRKIRGAGVLEFRILADRDPSSPNMIDDPKNPQFKQPIERYKEQLARYGPRPRPGDTYRWLPIDDVRSFLNIQSLEELELVKDSPGRPIVEEYAGRYYVLAYDVDNPPMRLLHTAEPGRRWSLQRANSYRDPMSGQNLVTFALDPRGGQQFGELTGYNIGRQLAIFLDNEAVSHATIRSRITQHCQIEGDFSPERASNLVRTLEAGSLPARLKETPLSEVTIGPSLGQTNREKGMKAAIWGGILVAVFMLVYYGIAGGGVANIALALNLLFVLSIMALMQATFTLPGVAGLVLTVGMAIDANVLIFERIREERERGVVFRKALNLGYDKALSTIVDANLTTLITCVILGTVASEEVKGFAIVLGIGIATSMFTALFVTRLIFNTLIAKGVLNDLHFMQLIRRPTIDWMSLRGIFWPSSIVAVVLGGALFLGMSTSNPERVFDIEFLGGTSVQVDLREGVTMTDEDMARMVTATSGEEESAVMWLNEAANHLLAAKISPGELPGQFVMESSALTGDQLRTLMFETIESRIERQGGAFVDGQQVTFVGRPGELTVENMPSIVAAAADRTRQAASRLRSARVQTVGDYKPESGEGLAFEVVTTETNRQMVQSALIAALGDQLSIQQPIPFTIVRDEAMTREDYFIVEESDQYLSDVIGAESSYDVRSYRGGVAIWIKLDAMADPVTPTEVERRLREVGLQPEFEQFRTRESAVYPLGAAQSSAGGQAAYKEFAIVAVDPGLIYDEAQSEQWADQVAATELALVRAALEAEKSLSKVVQFAPQVAGQTRNRAVFATILALVAIVAYVWIRFGTKEYGVAAVVCLVHDVAITLGLVALSELLVDTVVGRALLLDGFKVDLAMVAAVLTVIGYSLNDTIVVFDRIRENKGKTAQLSGGLINDSINQTMSRTLLTGITTLIVVAMLYIFGGGGVHGFAFALLCGIFVGTYSSIGVASALLFRPRILWAVATAIIALTLVGLIFLQVEHVAARLILSVVAVIVCFGVYLRNQRETVRYPASQPVGV